MSVNSLEDMSNEDLLAAIAPPDLDDRAEGFDNDVLLKAVRQRQSDSVDTETGAPLGIRSFVGAAQTQADKLATLREYDPNAVPVEVFDPENGAKKFGRGKFDTLIKEVRIAKDEINFSIPEVNSNGQ